MTIAPFTLEDIEFDLAELEPADWEDMAARIRWHLSTPYAVAIKSIFGEALVSGLGLAIAHNGSGWIGDRLMHPRFRGPELESELVSALLKELEAKGCATVSVLAAEAAIPPLTELGFVPDGHYVTYAGGQCEVPTLDEVELFEPHHSLGVLRLDKLASGEDRREVMSEHFYASRIFVNKGKVQGNYMVLLGEGLIVAENAFAGEELLRWHLPHVTEITLPEANHPAIEFLQQWKYTEQRRVLRMVRGPKLSWRPEMVWGRIGNNLG
jgi:GNAT superfamily N-acetyltransferase